MGPTGTDGRLKDGEARIHKLTDGHCEGAWSAQTPTPVQSCCISMHGMSGMLPRCVPMAPGQRQWPATAMHAFFVQAATKFVAPADNHAQRRPPQRSNSDAGTAAEAAAAGSSRPGCGPGGTAEPPANGPPKQSSPQRLAAGPPAGVSAPVSEAHPTIAVAPQACFVSHVFLTFCPPEERSPLGWLPASYQILSVITHLLCVCSAASHTCFRLTATCLDLAAHRKGCCHVTRLLFSANVFDRHASVLSTSSCEQARLAKILAGLERFGSPSRTLKQAVSCTEEHLRKSSEIASPRSGQR